MNDPRLNLGLQTKLSQKLLITPQMKQSLSLLQMPITELTQEISSYLETNPALETSEPDFSDIPDDEMPEQATNSDQSLLDSLNSPEWDDYINEGNSNELSFTPLTDEDMMNYEQYVAGKPSLSQHLLFQLRTLDLTEEELFIGEEIIGNLSDDGYFRADVDEIAGECETTPAKVKKVLEVIKTFDPSGIASQNLAECVLSQLDDVGASEGEILQIKELFDKFSEEMASFKYDEIVKKSGLDRENINDLMELVRRTDPRPGLNFSGADNSYILPDVYIVREGDNFEVVLNESGLPRVRLNTRYLKALKSGGLDADTKNYLEDKVKNAVWILKSLQKRQKAIYKVAKAIVDIQHDFLLKGEAFLKPLRLKDIAEITELHESTVSRVTAGKYALTDQGLLELKSFFSKGMDSDDGDVSTRKIKVMIREIVDNEPTDKPYSDEKIVGLLAAQGIDVARRTVAKYRDEINIPTMSQRKRMRR